MAVATNIGTAAGNLGDAPNVTVPAGGVPAGSTIIVIVWSGSEQAASVTATDTAGNVYTRGYVATASFAAMLYTENCLALTSGNTITVGGAGSGNNASTAFYVTGLKVTGAFDSAVSASANVSDSFTLTSGTPAAPAEFIVGAVAQPGSFTFSNPGGWAAPPNTAGPGTGGSQTISGGSTTNSGSSAISWHPTTSGLGGSAYALVVGFKTADVTVFNQQETSPVFSRRYSIIGY